MLAWTKSVPELRWLGLGLTTSPIPKRLTTVFDIREYCCWRHLLCKHIPTKNVGMVCLVDAGAIILPILLHGWKKTDRRRSSTPHFLMRAHAPCSYWSMGGNTQIGVANNPRTHEYSASTDWPTRLVDNQKTIVLRNFFDGVVVMREITLENHNAPILQCWINDLFDKNQISNCQVLGDSLND